MVNNKSTARCAYELIRIFQNAKPDAANADEIEQHIIKLKRDVRDYLNRPQGPRHIICSDFDSYTVLIRLPENICEPDEAEEFFLNNEYKERPNSPYDCTGRAFTSWYKVFQRRGHFMAYHHVCIDV